ncbi:MAG: hypothetical protein ACRC62_02195, partial [Microcoleus sp.]
MAKSSDFFPVAKTGTGGTTTETDPVAVQRLLVVDANIARIDAAIAELRKSSIAKFNDARAGFIVAKAAAPTQDPLFSSVVPSLDTLETELNGLDLTKSSTDSVNGLNAVIKALEESLTAVQEPVDQFSVDDVTAKVAAVNAAIATTKTSPSEAEAINKLKADLAAIDKVKASQAEIDKINTAIKTANDAIDALKAGGGGTADLTAVNKAIADADTEIKALKAKQDATAESLQKTTQSVADLAI